VVKQYCAHTLELITAERRAKIKPEQHEALYADTGVTDTTAALP
jgi:hypothetical protein